MDVTPKRPRPRRKPHRKHPHRTTLRWSNDDYARLQAEAERAGVTLGTFIRSRTLATPTTRPRRRASVDLLALSKALAQVSRVGGNLHQLVRHLNFGGVPEEGEVNAALTGFNEMVEAVMDAIGKERR